MKGKLNLRLLWTFVLGSLVSFCAWAQDVTVTGNVKDQFGEPLTGVTVREVGSTGGTITDIDGNYSLKVKNTQAQLEFRYTGMTTQTLKLAGKSKLDVTLAEDIANLDEVVVVGYGTMKKSDLAGASVSMDESKLKQSIVTSVDQTLQGRAAGVQAIATSGAPGSSSSIRVRGQATINANAEPLYVIDGVIFQSSGSSGASLGLGDALGNGSVSTISPLSTINPSDIVSMEILKDASATAIYGAQGSNGVVLITTKRGKAGEAKFTYDGMVAMNRQTKRLDVMNLREYAEYYNDLAAAGELSDPSTLYSDPSLLGKGTNWQDAIFQTAFQQSHQVSAQGGNETVQYYVSGNFMDQEGTIIGSEFQRFGARVNLDAQLKKWLKMGFSASYSATDENLKLADSDEGIINYSLTNLPDMPIYDVEGNYATTSRRGITAYNPIAEAMEKEILLKRQQLNGNLFFDIKPIDKLVWHAEFGYDINASRAQTYVPVSEVLHIEKNQARAQKNSGNFWQLKNYVTYSDKIGDHSFTGMVGQECWESHYDYASVYNTDLPSDDVHNPKLGGGTPTIGYGYGSSSMASFFTRWTYNYHDRYLATYTYRYDGSSNFGPDKRWAGFHSVALAWRFSNEKWFEPLNEWIDNGKLRLGWGQTGNSSIPAYSWGTSISRVATGLGLGYRPDNIPNTSIQWESQEQWNVGLDLNTFGSRLNFVFDFYKKESDDMLMPLSLPTYMGTGGNPSSQLKAPNGNYGTIENKGFEVTVSARPVQGKHFEWDTEFQLSRNKNKLTKLAGGDDGVITGAGQWGDVVTATHVGQSLFNFYGYKTDGVYEDFDDIINSAPRIKSCPTITVTDPETGAVRTIADPDPSKYSRTNTVWPGDIKFKDVNGDGVIDDNDKTNIGSPWPTFTFGWNNTFRYKNFDLSVFINGSVGNKVLNYLAIKLTRMNSPWTNQLKDGIEDRAIVESIDGSKAYPAAIGANTVYNWYDDVTNVHVRNAGTDVPRPTIANYNGNDEMSDRYIEDGSYVRIKNVSLGYTFPKKVIRSWGLENLRAYVNLQNLATFTSYTGFDPEIGASTASANVYGLDNGRYPSPTTYSFGLSVTF